MACGGGGENSLACTEIEATSPCLTEVPSGSSEIKTEDPVAPALVVVPMGDWTEPADEHAPIPPARVIRPLAAAAAELTELADTPTLMRAMRLFIGNNSGPHHIAAALGVPTVGVHSGVVSAREWGPMGPMAVAVQREMSCGPCYLEKASDRPVVMMMITATIFATGPWTESRICCSGCSHGMFDPAARAWPGSTSSPAANTAMLVADSTRQG